MPEDRETESHADGHDRDKLERWRLGLEQDETGAFPVCAIFLVSENDQRAHDSFREFRDSFESRKAGFHHVVIFGQHGVSTTVRALLADLSLPPEHLPCLVLAAGAEAKEAMVFKLPAGNEPEPSNSGETPTPEALLGQVESLIDRDKERDGRAPLGDLRDLDGGVTRDLGGKSLVQVAASLQTRV